MERRRTPVFYDPAQERWPRIRGALVGVTALVVALLTLLTISIVATPRLPHLGLETLSPDSDTSGLHSTPPPAPVVELPPSTPEKKASSKAHPRGPHGRPVRRPAENMTPRPPTSTLTAAFLVNWDDASFASFKENLDALDLLIPEWVHVNQAGELIDDNFTRQKEVLAYIKPRRPELRLMPLVNNFCEKNWQGAEISALLTLPTERKALIGRLLRYTERFPCAGLTLDFEELHATALISYGQFLSELAAELHQRKLLLAVTASFSNPAFPYTRLGQIADYVILLAYDQHWAGAPPGPIAGIDWFRTTLEARCKDVPVAKMIIGLGNYAYDWKDGKRATGRSFDDTMILARERDAKIAVEPTSLNPGFCYYDEKNERHEVWMLDATTVFNQLVVAETFRPRGFALWRLGSEDPALWKIFGKNVVLDDAAAAKLEDMQFRFGIDFTGEGEIIRVASKPQDGKREVIYDPAARLITSETFETYPSPYVIRRYGAMPRKVALTFDDGPTTDYTPAILDILRDAKVPGTFFIVGQNGELHPDLVRRIHAEGHVLGNHTFTHPNIATISPLQLKVELSATQRLVESLTGHRVLLFRPPYGEDSDPSTADEIRPLETVGELGYVTVGMRIDPYDWQRPEPEEICRRVVAAAEHGDGQVVLLHDGGGDRVNTVRALPMIINALRERGFEFVSVATLLGKTRDQVMPVLPGAQQASALFNRAAFGAINLGVVFLEWLFFAGIVLGITRLAGIAALAVLGYWRKKRIPINPNYLPGVAVIVPAFNEEKVIVQTVRSLLASDYPSAFEIIVVDDGSADLTFIKVREAFAHEPRVVVFKKPNAGKSNALNFGIECTQAEIIIAMDADTVFQPDTIRKLVRHFETPGVGAVAGNAKVGNRVNILTRWQALEYITSQNLDRRAFEVLNCITVVPGAVGAWRRRLVVEAGGFTRETLAEDADLTIAIRRLGYRIVYEEEAIARTEAPESVGQFVKQRYRWMFGTLQAGWKHKDMLLRPGAGALGFVALPNIFIFQVFFPLISPVMDLLTLGALAGVCANVFWHVGNLTPQATQHIFWFYILFVSIDYLAAMIAFCLEPDEDKRLLFWLFWQRFFYRQLMYYVAIKSTLASLRGIAVGWGALDRKASVKLNNS